MEKMKISCPVCGTVLSVPCIPGIEKKFVTCPVCHNKSAFKAFKIVSYPPSMAAAQSAEDDPTAYGGTQTPKENYTFGKLISKKRGIDHQLTPGRLVIGRRCNGSTAQLQVPCDCNRMSREHLVIETKKVQGKGVVHYASLYKEKVNPTYIGAVKLEYGDSLVLNHGDVIKLPGLDGQFEELVFEIPDEDRTEI